MQVTFMAIYNGKNHPRSNLEFMQDLMGSINNIQQKKIFISSEIFKTEWANFSEIAYHLNNNTILGLYFKNNMRMGPYKDSYRGIFVFGYWVPIGILNQD